MYFTHLKDLLPRPAIDFALLPRWATCFDLLLRWAIHFGCYLIVQSIHFG